MKKKKISLPIRMLIGMVLGIIVGIVVGPQMAVIKPFGTAFINLLKMSMVPVVALSITLSVATVDDLKSFGRFGGKTFLTYVITTCIAAAVAICYGFLIQPGAGFAGDTAAGAVEREMPTLADTLLNIIPTNIVQSLADANLIAIIFFCIMFGIGLAMLGEERKKPVVDFFQCALDAVLKMINVCLLYAPFGVFALMAAMAGQYGKEVFSTLGRFLLTDYAGFLTQMIVVYGILLGVFCRINIFTFISRARAALISAFTTTSSAATVPIEMEMSETHLGVPKKLGGFCFPFGATVNQNGTAINVTTCVLFSAQVYGIHLTFTELVTIIGLALISSIGCAGVPAGGTIFTLMILSQFGIPTDAFGLIIASYTLVDVMSTTMNICGDMVCAVLVSKSEKVLNMNVWKRGYDPEKAREEAALAEATQHSVVVD